MSVLKPENRAEQKLHNDLVIIAAMIVGGIIVLLLGNN